MSDETPQRTYRPSGFFVVRTPLLPVEELERWAADLELPDVAFDAGDEAPDDAEIDEALMAAVAADRGRLRQRLGALLERPEIREALFVASPSLFDEGVPVWEKKPDGKSGRRAEAALVRYLVRMTARATPFGLFSGCTVGSLNGDAAAAEEETDVGVHLAPLADYRRHTRFDMDYLFALAEELVADETLRRELTFRANSSLYRAAGRWRYAEARLEGQLRTYHLVAVEQTPYLDVTLERAARGARLEDLAAALVADDPEVTLEEAREFIGELVAAQLLVPELSPRVTGGEAVESLTEVLDTTEAGADAARVLEKAEAALRELDDAGLGNQPAGYRRLAETLGESLPTDVELSRLVQVDMIKPAHRGALPQGLLDDMTRGVEALHRLSSNPGEDALDRFRKDFNDRWGDRVRVPLTEVLDEEIGIGFGGARGALAEASPLLAGLPVAPPGSDRQVPWGRREIFLLDRVQRLVAEGETVLELEDEDLDLLAPPVEDGEPADGPPLPDAFHVMVMVAAPSAEALARGDYQLYLRNAAGPSGARLLGRFCHADPTLERGVREHLAQEEGRRPEAIFAEIIHLPQGRVGNVLARPVLRGWEIPFLGRPAVDEEHQIPVDDLEVSVVGGRVVLTSREHRREVIPRLTTAHNFVTRSLGMYRFLCALQSQGVAGGLSWNWGPLDSAPFLPRVTWGRLVLARARWRLLRPEIAILEEKEGAALVVAARRLRAARRLPRHVVLADSDNELLVDLENILCLESFVDAIKNRPDATLLELFPATDQAWIRGPEGRFVEEILVPYVRSDRPPEGQERRRAEAVAELAAEEEAAPDAAPERPEVQPVRVEFPPGTEWLYLKLYSGTATADMLLREVVAPVARQALQEGWADHWFFIRYGDPDWHLRVRFHGEPGVLHGQVLPRLQGAAAQLLQDGRLWKVQVDTYQREVTRYGGPAGMEPAERLFWADSEAVLGIVMLIEGDEGADARWRLAVAGVDSLFATLGLDLEARRRVAERLRESFTREFQPSLGLKRQIGDRHRRERKALEQLMAAAPDGDHPLAPGLQALAQGARLAASASAELRRREEAGLLSSSIEDLAPSYAHMHVNRLIRSEGRAHELVLYEFLYRHYNAQIARARAMARQAEKAKS